MDVKIQRALKKCGYQELCPYQEEVVDAIVDWSELIGLFNKARVAAWSI